MTEIIEEFRIKVVLSHDQTGKHVSKLYGGDMDLHKAYRHMLIGMLERMELKGAERSDGMARGVTIRIERTGIFEVPELSGGDN